MPTKGEWWDESWNFTRGCWPVSPGCLNCYAAATAYRFAGQGLPYEGLAIRKGGRAVWTGEVRFVAEKLAEPLRWRSPKVVFVNSMSDLYHPGFTDEQIAAAFGIMAATPQHTYIILTKQAERARAWFRWVADHAATPRQWSPHAVYRVAAFASVPEKYHRELDRALWLGTPHAWPLPNVWLGVSAENQAAADERVPLLLETPAALRFLSCEPLLGPVNVCAVPDSKTRPADFSARYTPLGDLGWVIAGCESGRGARPAQVDWYRSLRDQCAAARVPFFLKQAVEHVGEVELWPPEDGGSYNDQPTRYKGPSQVASVISLPYLDGVQHTARPSPTPQP